MRRLRMVICCVYAVCLCLVCMSVSICRACGDKHMAAIDLYARTAHRAFDSSTHARKTLMRVYVHALITSPVLQIYHPSTHITGSLTRGCDPLVPSEFTHQPTHTKRMRALVHALMTSLISHTCLPFVHALITS